MTNDAYYHPSDIVGFLDIGEDKIRNAIRDECKRLVPDELRLVPGGRVIGTIMRIHRGVYDAVTSGRAVTRTAPASPSFAHPLIRTIDRQAS